MKILIVHTSYQIKGGEDNVFEQETNLLKQKNEVRTITFHNLAGWRGGIQFCLSVWNVWAAIKLKKMIYEFKPDLMHIHNLHFAVGPIAIQTANSLNIPVVLTLHNYRLLCPSATLFFDGHLFLNSLKKGFPWTAVRKKVYRNSLLQTFWLAVIIYLHKLIGTWKKVDNYIALTHFGKQLYLDSDLKFKSAQISVKPNFVEDKGYVIAERGQHFLFVGRLTEEKGLIVLIKAFAATSHKLHIMGEGPLRVWLERECSINSNIQYLGRKSHAEITEAMKHCSALVFPSIWFEGMPLTVIEALASGTPVITSDLGAMKDMVTNNVHGLYFKPGDSHDLQEKISDWQKKVFEEKEAISKNARQKYEESYTPEKNIILLENIYQHVLQKNHYKLQNKIQNNLLK